MLFSFLLSFLQRVFCFTGALDKGGFPKPLSKAEEAKYLARAMKGDKEAKDVLIRHNMRLVAHIVKKYTGAAETDDLISVGSIGLIKAINTYRPEKGTTLATYTARCVENEILMLLRANKKHKCNVSLTDPVGTDKDGNELTLMDLLAEKEDVVFDSVERSLLGERLERLMRAKLTEREYTVLDLRYGLHKPPMPQREVARSLGISRSYISRIEKKAIGKLRAAMEEARFLSE